MPDRCECCIDAHDGGLPRAAGQVGLDTGAQAGQARLEVAGLDFTRDHRCA